ncbi:MAG: efflux RND transporter periplasmic adaptor subunit [Chthonomonadales bacterium]
MNPRLRATLWILAALIGIGALARVRMLRVRQLQDAPRLEEPPLAVQTAAVRQGRVSATITEQGVLVAETESAVAPQVMARCIEVNKHEGDRVREGEVIARLDDEELRDILNTQASEMLSGREAAAAQFAEVARAREDVAARSADVEGARAAAAAAQSEVDAARQLLAAQTADMQGAQQAVAAQQADVDRVRENLAAAEAAAATQRSKTARDRILYENRAISQEQWEASQTALVQSERAVAALKRQIEALGRGVDAAKMRVVSLQRGMDATRQRIASLSNNVEQAHKKVRSLLATLADARQRVAAQRHTAEAAERKAQALAQNVMTVRTRLGYTLIRAPYDGVITARLAEPGNLVMPGQPIYRILKPGSVKVIVNLPQEDLGLVRTGTHAILSAPAGSMRAYVTRVYPSLSNSRLGVAEILLARAPFGLKSGSTVQVALQTLSKEGIVVPIRSVLDGAHGSLVFKVENGVARSVPIVVLTRGTQEAVVSGNLSPGDVVVVGTPAELMVVTNGRKIAAIQPGGSSDEVR